MSEVKESRFRVGGMDCASCASKIDTAVRRMPGVFEVSVSDPVFTGLMGATAKVSVGER